jgi:hypothetical protein
LHGAAYSIHATHAHPFYSIDAIKDCNKYAERIQHSYSVSANSHLIVRISASPDTK